MSSSVKLFFVSTFMLFSSAVCAEPAVIVTDFGCTFLDGDGGMVFTTDTKSVTTIGGKGSNVMLQCRAKGVANSTGQAVKWNYENTGLRCGTFQGLTDDWYAVVSASGNMTVTCKIHF
jgi:hypothetical protein